MINKEEKTKLVRIALRSCAKCNKNLKHGQHVCDDCGGKKLDSRAKAEAQSYRIYLKRSVFNG